MLGFGMIEEKKHLEKSNWSWRSSLKVIDLWHPTTCNVMKHEKRTCKWKFAGNWCGAFMLYLLKKLVEEEILALPENDRDFSDVIVFHVWMVQQPIRRPFKTLWNSYSEYWRHMFCNSFTTFGKLSNQQQQNLLSKSANSDGFELEWQQSEDTCNKQNV